MDVKMSGDRKRDVSIIFAIVIVLVFFLIADIYISISMGTFGHRKYKSRGEDGNK